MCGYNTQLFQQIQLKAEQKPKKYIYENVHILF